MPSTECTLTIAAAAAVDHRREEGPGDGEDVAQVDLVHGCCHDSGVDSRTGTERPVVADVVDEHVDPAVLGEHGVGQPRDIVVGSCTSTTWLRIGAAGAGRSPPRDALGAFRIDLGDLDERPVLREEPGDARRRCRRRRR